MWRLTFEETGYKKFLTSEWLVEMKTSDPADPAQRCGDSESGNIGLTSSYKFASLGASHLQVTYK